MPWGYRITHINAISCCVRRVLFQRFLSNNWHTVERKGGNQLWSRHKQQDKNRLFLSQKPSNKRTNKTTWTIPFLKCWWTLYERTRASGMPFVNMWPLKYDNLGLHTCTQIIIPPNPRKLMWTLVSIIPSFIKSSERSLSVYHKPLNVAYTLINQALLTKFGRQ